MSKLVVFKLGDGSFEQGFPVTLQIGEDGDRPSTEITGKLPPNPEIIQYYSYWQSAYYRLGLRFRLEAAAVQVTNVSIVDDCYQAAQILSHNLNSWLHSECFRAIREKLLEKLVPSDVIRAIVQTEDPLLQRLPWHLCDLFSPYPKAEIAISTPVYESATKTSVKRAKIRILAILGSSAGINIQADRNLLENLPGTEVGFLVEPSRQELNNQLWADRGWDILFFAGHSASQVKCEFGRIYLNQTESLTIHDLKHALHTAVERGLKLAIFNSCDGLGLARELNSLHIPQVVVMREPVPDLVAQEFLKNFLKAFSGGKSLYLSVREARERLQGWESEYPCASWLPAIYQNPAEVPPTWQNLVASDRPQRQRQPNFGRVLLTSAIVTALVMGVRYLGMLQGLELQAYDRLMQLRPEEKADSRILVVTVTEEDLHLPEQKDGKGSLSNLALEKLLHKLEQLQPRVIGLDIYRDFPVEPKHTNLANYLRHDRLVAVCQGSDLESDSTGVAPPPEVSPDRLGFSDVAAQPDNILRRHLLFMTPNPASRCPASYAFSVQLATRYLHFKGIVPKSTPAGYLQLGKTIFKPLEAHTGGYQTVDMKGHQVLIDSRPRKNIAPQVTLKQVLTGQINPNLVKDSIVLIGTTAPSYKDYLSTPYNQKLPGVMVQAQLVSHILNTVLDGRSPIWVWSFWAECLWVLGWSVVGGVLVLRFSPLHLTLAGGAAVGSLCLLCFGLLTQNGWVPLIPPALALVVTGASVSVFSASQTQQQQISLLPSPEL